MSKLALPTVTLVCIDCYKVERAIPPLEISKSRCDFGNVMLMTSKETDYPHVSIPEINSLNDYSAFCMKRLHEYISTDHLLIVQHDGWVLNPESWRPHWLSYDYIGPLFLQEWQCVDERTVGIGGFSLRSKALMKKVSELLPPWDGRHSYDGTPGDNWAYEDGVISKHLRSALEAHGFKFAPPLEAAVFGYGDNPSETHFYPKPFGFHTHEPVQIARICAGATDVIRILPP